MLSLSNLHVNYGPVEAVRGIDIEVERGAITAIVGANGAGKSSTLQAVSGLVPSKGSIGLDGSDINGLSAVRRVGLGVGHVLEGHRVFGDQPVSTNLQLGAYLRIRGRVDRDEIAADMDAVYSRFPILKARESQRAGTLSGGEQQMLAIAIALMQRPRVLLLDEPSLGLAPRLIDEVMSIISALRDEGHSILLVEQATNIALKVADYGYVMSLGRVVGEGEAESLRDKVDVISAYLGKKGSGE